MTRPPAKPIDPDVAEWLTTDEASRLLDEHAAADATPAVVTRLRRSLPADRAAAVLEQVELRRRAKAKFRRPERMLFTRKGLEQATDEWIAEYKAERLGGFGPVVDLCCGVGGDLAGLTNRSVAATGVELDPASARFAEWNSGAGILRSDADEADLAAFGAWHCDPDRRAEGLRTTRPELHTPSAETLSSWMSQNPRAAIKLAPAARVSDAWSDLSELEWISRRGECRQLVVWSEALTKAPGRRRATRVFEDGLEPASFVGDPAVVAPRVEKIGRYVYEPDAAILAAGLEGALAERLGIAAFTAAAYLTGDVAVDDPLVAAFEVTDVLPLDRKRLSALLAERRVGRLEIKARGVDLDPERLRNQLRPRGDGEATLIVAPDPVAGRRKPLAIIARRQ